MKEEVNKLQDLISRYQDLRVVYNNLLDFNPQPSKEDLATIEHNFCELQADLAFIIPKFFRLRTMHDDKRSTATKAEITHLIHQEEKSFAKSESMAAASDAYKRFLDDRAQFYELYETVTQLQSSIQNYLTAIAHRFKIRDSQQNLME